MKTRLRRYLPFFICLLFFLPALTAWSQTSITSVTIDGVDPTGRVYRDTVTVAWTVTGETPGEVYDVLYSSTGSGGPWIAPTGGTIAANVPSGTYSVTWNTTGVSDGSNYWVRIYAQTVPNPTLSDGPFTIQNTGPIISITAPQDGTVISGTQNINWNVTNTWTDDKYRIQYRFNATADPGTIGTFTDITTVETTIRTYALNTTLYTTGHYRLKVLGTVSGSWDSVYVVIDQNVVTGITIVHPTAENKCRGTARIEWSVTGTPRIVDTFNIYWYNPAIPPPGDPWQVIATGVSRYARTYDWNTTTVTDRQTKIKVEATSSDVSGESAQFIVDNTAPVIEEIKISPLEPSGMVPKLSPVMMIDPYGRGGRSTLFVIASGWYSDLTPTVPGDIESYPLITVKAKDPRAADQSFAGIYRIAYRIYSDITDPEWTSWRIIPPENMTYGTNNETATGTFRLNAEGSVVYAEVVVIDDAQYSLNNLLPPNDTNYISSVYAAGGGWGNYSLLGKAPGEEDVYPYDTELPVQIDVTPPEIKNLWVDNLPDGPVIGTRQWYPADVNKRPLIRIEADDTLSSVFQYASFHTVDSKAIPLIHIPYSSDLSASYLLNPLNGETVTIIHDNFNDCPGVRRRGGTLLSNGLWFPVYNAYGKTVRARVWDNAGNISGEKVDHPSYAPGGGGIATSVELYVDNIPPVSTVALANNYWPKSPLDVGSKLRGYWDIWRHNKNFPRPEDAAPPAGYPQGWIDYLCIASNQNPTGLTPASFTISTDDRPSYTVPSRRYYEIFQGYPDWLIQYDYFFSDFSATNLGVGVSDTFSSPWYRYRQTDNTVTDSAVLADIKGVWADPAGTAAFYVGEKGVTGEWDTSEWLPLINGDTNNLNAASGTADDNIYACGDGGTFLYFDGNTWTKREVRSTGLGGVFGTGHLFQEDFHAIIKFTATSACMVGKNGRILYSSTPLQTTPDNHVWTAHTADGDYNTLSGINLNAVWGDGLTADRLCAVGDGGTVVVFQGGMDWELQAGLTGGNLYGVWGKDFDGDTNMDFVVVGNIDYVDGANRYIGYLYYDSVSDTWTLKSTGIASVTPDNFRRLPLYGITGDSATDTVYLAGARGTVLKGVYSGSFTWTDLTPNMPAGVTAALRSVGIDGSGNLHVAGDSGRTLYSADDGTTWLTENLWSNWISGATASFTLNPGTTALEYFALDDLGNEEPHHKIIDPGDGTIKTIPDGKGLGNMRTDDNVPEPDAVLNPASPAATGWYNISTGAPTITLTFLDTAKWNDYLPDGVTPGSGIKKFQYGLGTTGTPPAAIVPNVDYTFGMPFSLTNGMYALTYRAVDNIGNTNGDTTTPYIPYGSNPIKIDLVRPSTTVAIVSGKLQLTATDNLSGVKMIRYNFDPPGGPTDGTQYIESLSMVGVTAVYYWGEDNAGNFENYNTFYPGLADSVPPVTTISLYSGAFYQHPITGTRYIASSGNANSLLVTRFSLSSVDPAPGTGILTGYPVFSFNDTDYFSYLTPFSVLPGSSSVYYYARDSFGNEELPHKQYLFTIDDTAPAIAIAVTCGDDGARVAGWYNVLSGVPTVTITVVETGSGTAYVRYDTAGGIPATDYTAPFTLPGGTHNLIARSADNVGNLAPDTSYDYNPVQVDIVKPVSTLTPSSGMFYLSATDDYSGVGTLNYVFILADDSRTDTVTVSATSTSFAPYAGTKQVDYWVVDVAGNREDIRTFNMSGLDDTPPVTTISVYSGPSYTNIDGLWLTSSANTELAPTQLQVTSVDPPDPDTGFSSGIAPDYPKYMFADDLDWTIYSTPFEVGPAKLSPVSAYARDGVGNEETPAKERAFNVDDDKPYGSAFDIEPASPSVTGWYNIDTGAPTITITGTTDDGCGVKEVRYTTNSTDPTAATGTKYTVPFVLNNTQVSEIRYAGFDNLGHREVVQSYLADIFVDTVPPAIITAVNYPTKQFSLTVTDALSGVDWANVTYEFVLDDDSILGPFTYTEGSSVDIPDDAKNMLVIAMDVAGNRAEQTTVFPVNRKISGYIKTYKGTAMSGINVLLCGDTNSITTTSAAGYYEFTGLRALGSYYVMPVLTNNLPAVRFYPVLGASDKTNQDFTAVPGWMSRRYDRGGSRDYRFGSTLTALEPLSIAESASIPASGINMLSGFLTLADQRINAVMSDGSRVRGYVYNSGTATYTSALSRLTGYNLSLVGSVRADTTIDLVLCGTGNDVAEIRDNTGEPIRYITTGILGVPLQTAPVDTEWSTNFSIGQGGILFTGAGTGYSAVFLYNYLTDAAVWETSLTQAIIPGTSAICLREDGRAMVLAGAQSDAADLTLAALDVMTGGTVWTRTFAGIRGKITPVVFINEDGWDDIFAVRTSTNTSTGLMRVYQLNPATGAIQKDLTGFSLTPSTNTSFRAAVADVNSNGVKELVLSDGSGNMYVLDVASETLISAANRGILWAVVDLDGKAGGNKEIIVSANNEIRVLSSTLDVLATRDMGVSDIQSVIVSDMTNNNRVEILVSIPGSTRILRAALSTDIPGTPTGIDAYSTGGRAYIVWAYTPTSADLSGFRIWRSTDPGSPDSWALVGTTTSEARTYTDTPGGGIYAYRVSAYNDFGETFSSSSALIEVVEVAGDSGGGATCFIATAAYGTPMAEEVIRLKRFRDRYLLASRHGRAFVRWYYRHSPAVADYIRQRKVARALVRASLRPLLWILSAIM